MWKIKRGQKLFVLSFKDHYLIKQHVGKTIISVQKLSDGSPLGRLSQRNYVLIKKKKKVFEPGLPVTVNLSQRVVF